MQGEPLQPPISGRKSQNLVRYVHLVGIYTIVGSDIEGYRGSGQCENGMQASRSVHRCSFNTMKITQRKIEQNLTAARDGDWEIPTGLWKGYRRREASCVARG